MGWISDLFKRKRGGTAVGNFIRTQARARTFGILGRGRGLRKYWNEQDA